MRPSCASVYVPLAALLAGATPQLVVAFPTALGTAFTYQGQLRSSGSPVNNTADFQFLVWDSLSGGSQVGAPTYDNNITISDGLFTAPIDAGVNAFNGQARWLEIAVRSPAGSGSFVTLSPRQPITAIPYALQTRNLTTDAAGNLSLNSGAKLTVTTPSFGIDHNSGGIDLSTYIDGIAGWFGTKSNHPLYLYTNNGINPVATLTTTQRVGIGTTTPNERLTVAGSMEIGTGSGDYQHLRIGGGNSNGFLYGSYPHFGDGIHLGYNYYAESSGVNIIVHPDGGTSRLSLGYGTIALATMAPLYGEPINRVVVNPVGNVGIGIASPTSTLHVVGSDTTFQGVVHARNDSGSNGYAAVFETNCYDHTAGVYGVVTTPDADSFTSGVYGGNYGQSGARGITGAAFSSTGTVYGVVGDSWSAAGYDFYAAGSGVDYGSPSSIRWKRNIAPIADSLDKVEAMRGVFFDWDAEHGGHHAVGMIGEEVGKVLPEIVSYEPDGQFVTGMDYSKLTPLLVEAVKALRAEKDAQIAALQHENQHLQDRLAALEDTVARLNDRKESR